MTIYPVEEIVKDLTLFKLAYPNYFETLASVLMKYTKPYQSKKAFTDLFRLMCYQDIEYKSVSPEDFVLMIKDDLDLKIADPDAHDFLIRYTQKNINRRGFGYAAFAQAIFQVVNWDVPYMKRYYQVVN